MPIDSVAVSCSRITVHTEQIPEYLARELVEPLTGLMEEFYARPGMREKQAEWLKGDYKQRYGLE